MENKQRMQWEAKAKLTKFIFLAVVCLGFAGQWLSLAHAGSGQKAGLESSHTAEAFSINVGLNDAWFNPATSGQGMLISVYPESKRFFVAWFTFDTQRPADSVDAQLGGPGQRWLTAQGTFTGDTANLTIYVTTGGVFDAAIPAVTTDGAGDGTMTVEFADCTQGLVNYEITSLGISGVIPIQRIDTENVPICEELAAETSTMEDPEPAGLAGITAAHNAVREGVGVAPLTWDTDLAAVAQAWADSCTDVTAPMGLVDHNNDRSDNYPGYVGENIFGSSLVPEPQRAVDAWASEVEDYNYESNTCSGVCGHYTQLVWAETKRVGCGISQCDGLQFGGTIVCNYSPGGNTGGRPY